MANAHDIAGQNKGPQIAINGFIAWLLTLVLTVVYLLWAILPDAALRRLHITYYPDRYWAVAVPAIMVMFFFFYFNTHVCLVFITSPPLDDGHCVTTIDSKEDTQTTPSALSKTSGSVPQLVDIPVTVTNKLLFLPWKSK